MVFQASVTITPYSPHAIGATTPVAVDCLPPYCRWLARPARFVISPRRRPPFITLHSSPPSAFAAAATTP